MSAITDDTAALVAAQLTVALCSRIERIKTRPEYNQRDAEADVLKIYLRYQSAVREATITHLGQPPKE